MNRFVKRVLDILFVRPCIICGKPVKTSDEINLCADCDNAVHQYGQTVSVPGRIVISVLPYEKYIRRAMFRFKFGNKKYYGYTFGELIYKRIKQFDWHENIDCVVCVPMKGRDRMYNQAAVIAGHVSCRMGIPFEENVLVKIKDNPPFYRLGKNERLKLVKGAFDICDNNSIRDKRILLIDDIYTTGATIGECRRVLMMNGAAEVFCVTACYGVLGKGKSVIK